MSDKPTLYLVKAPALPMDPRCPRKLKNSPSTFCPLAVLRLKAIRNAGKELTEEEESKLVGCPYAINHQLSNYCFFQYMEQYGESVSIPESEVAAMMGVSVDTVKKIEKVALQKVRDSEDFRRIKDDLDEGESVIDEKLSDEDLSIYV